MLKEEVQRNWHGAYDENKETDVPRFFNIILSHLVLKIKIDEQRKLRFKARLCTHGNRGHMEDDVRKDSATAHFDTIRLKLRLIDTLRYRLGCIEVKGAYLQCWDLKRVIYVRPPK